MQERSVMFPRLGPTHPGPIGDTKTGLLKRYSFMTIDPETGKSVRKYHQELKQLMRPGHKADVSSGLPAE